VSEVVEDGAAFFDAVKQMGLEGILAKQRGSAYLPGKAKRLLVEKSKSDRPSSVRSSVTRGAKAIAKRALARCTWLGQLTMN